jgi:hypothetical protein
MNDLTPYLNSRVALMEAKDPKGFAWTTPARKPALTGIRRAVGNGLIGLGLWIKPQAEAKPALKPNWQGR